MNNKIKFKVSSSLMGLSLTAPLVMSNDAKTAITPVVCPHPSGLTSHDAIQVPNNRKTASDQWVYRVSSEKPEWTQADEKQFLALARKEALGKISDEELRQLELVSIKREKLKSPLTTPEILFRAKQKQLEAQLVSALQEYFRFGKSDARTSYQIKG